MSNKFRFPLALSIGVVTGWLANSVVSNGAFFVGGTALGTLAGLWVLHLVEGFIGTHGKDMK